MSPFPFVKVGNMAVASFKSSRADLTRTRPSVLTVGMWESGERTRVFTCLELQLVSAVAAIVGLNYVLVNWRNI